MFITNLKIEQIDDDLFILLSDLVYYSEKYKITITVPERFVSDGPSVPRAPLLYFLFGNRGKRAGVLHDYLYRNGILSRSDCDDIFKEALLSSNKGKFTSFMMWAGVRVGGSNSYKKNPGCLRYTEPCGKVCTDCENHHYDFFKI